MVRLENVLKIFLQDVLKMSWRHLDDVFKTSWRRLENALKRSWRRFEDVLKTSWKRLEDVLKTYSQDEYIGLDQDVLKTSSEDVRLRRTYSSWRRLEDVFWRRRWKTSSRRLHQDECLLGLRGYNIQFTSKEFPRIWSHHTASWKDIGIQYVFIFPWFLPTPFLWETFQRLLLKTPFQLAKRKCICLSRIC